MGHEHTEVGSVRVSYLHILQKPLVTSSTIGRFLLNFYGKSVIVGTP